MASINPSNPPQQASKLTGFPKAVAKILTSLKRVTAAGPFATTAAGPFADDVDAACARQGVEIRRDRDPACLDRPVDGRRGGRFDEGARLMSRGERRCNGVLRPLAHRHGTDYHVCIVRGTGSRKSSGRLKEPSHEPVFEE